MKGIMMNVDVCGSGVTTSKSATGVKSSCSTES